MAENKKSDNRPGKFSRRTVLAGGAAAAFAAISTRSAKARDEFAIGNQAPGSLRSSDSLLKQRSRNDYRTSHAATGGRLSNPPEQLFEASLQKTAPHFDVVVVGSGYGASICAARLATHLQPGRRLCVIERGKEWIPGDFPDSFPRALAEQRSQMMGQAKRTVVNPLGLFNTIMNDEVNVLNGNGLGGTSLINASIALKPDMDVFWQSEWPNAFKDPAILNRYYQMAEHNLGLSLTPFDQTPKIVSRRMAAEAQGEGRFELSPINVTYDRSRLDASGRNRHGIIQRPCTLCGDCITGCNIGAKNTLATNYLPMAKRAGAEIYSQVEVRSIEKMQDGFYRLNLVYFDNTTCEIIKRYTAITTRMVVVGAGSPGSPSILMKSVEQGGLAVSPALGQRWSTNGDTIGFVVDKEEPSDVAGFGAYEMPHGPVGPTVQTTVHYRNRPNLRDRVIIQDAALPRAVNSLFSVLLRDPNLKNSMAMLGMGHEGSSGRIVLDKGNPKIEYPGLKEGSYRQMVFHEFEKLAAAHGGRYKRLKAFGDNLVTVHPLGGCGMSDDPRCGVVNHLGQVYDGQAAGLVDSQSGLPYVHHGLYVADGSIMPSSLGVNPLMTISALSEYIAENIVSNPAHSDMFLARR